MEVYVELSSIAEKLRKCYLCFEGKRNNRKCLLEFDFIPVYVKVMFVVFEPSDYGCFYDLGSSNRLREKLLDLLFEAGLIGGRSVELFTRRKLYFTYVVKCRGGSAEYCIRFLKEEIRVLEPDVICTLGESALKVFLKRSEAGLRDYVGSFVPEGDLRLDTCLGRPVFACYFPLGGSVADSVKIEHLRKLKSYVNRLAE